MKIKTYLSVICLLLLGSMVRASDGGLDIPTEELARETVLPKFDRPDNVKNRNVVTDGKVEVGFYYGYNFTEPIYNQSKLGLIGAYHFSEDRAFSLNFAKWMSGRNSQYVPGIEDKGKLDFNRIPDIEYSLWGHYEIKAYYGKISLTKQGVMNLSLYPFFGLGATKYSHKTYPGIDAGIGQKFYFSKSLALRVDIKLQYQQGPSPFLKDALKKSNSSTVDAGKFEDKFRLDNVMDVGLSFLF